MAPLLDPPLLPQMVSDRAQGALAALGGAAGRQADGAAALCCAAARACAVSPAYGRTSQVVAKLAGGLSPAAAAEVCAAAGAALREAACAGSADPDRALALAPQQLAVAECLAAGALREAGADAAAAVIGRWLPGHVPCSPASGGPCTCAGKTRAECAPLLEDARLSKPHGNACAWEVKPC